MLVFLDSCYYGKVVQSAFVEVLRSFYLLRSSCSYIASPTGRGHFVCCVLAPSHALSDENAPARLSKGPGSGIRCRSRLERQGSV